MLIMNVGYFFLYVYDLQSSTHIKCARILLKIHFKLNNLEYLNSITSVTEIKLAYYDNENQPVLLMQKISAFTYAFAPVRVPAPAQAFSFACSRLQPSPDFSFSRYTPALEKL